MMVRACLVLVIVVGMAAPAAAQYSIDWYTIDGGGGTSSAGSYELSGTIGQPDAGRASGGDYELVGGFWGAFGAGIVPGGDVESDFLYIGSPAVTVDDEQLASAPDTLDSFPEIEVADASAAMDPALVDEWSLF